MSVNRYNPETGKLERIAGGTGGTVYADAPIGAIQAYGGAEAPRGWLLCDGSAVSRTVYAELFAVIGTAYGAGDESTTFNIPDLRETAPVGVGENSTATIADHDTYTLGQFKDDQLQNHAHQIWTTNANASSKVGDIFAESGGCANQSRKDWNVLTGRVGTTTRGKRLGVNFIIKV